jgi:hypothetical protein
MLCYEDSHVTHENRNFKISLLHLCPFHHVIWNIFGGNSIDIIEVFYIQRRIIRIMAAAKRRASYGESFKV